MGARIVVRGHRFTGDFPSEQLLRPLLTKAMTLFSEELTQVVSEHVYKLMSEGRWNERPGKRFAYYRSRRYRLGGGRSRRSADSRTEARQSLRRPRSSAGANDNRTDEIDRHKFNFLVRALEKGAKHTSGDNMRMGRSGQRFNAAMSEAGLYDVTSALKKVQEMQAALGNSLWGEEADYQTARKKYQKGVQDFLYGANDHNRFFRESRLGQRYMRWAETAAQRTKQIEPAFNPNSSTGSRRISDERLLMHRRRSEAFADRARGKGVRRKHGAEAQAAGKFPWGFQTGTLANAWAQAQPGIRLLKDRYRITVAPDNRRSGRRPGAGDLTNYLKRTIRRLGGDPLLLKGDAPQQLTRTALERSKSRWAAMKIRLKR